MPKYVFNPFTGNLDVIPLDLTELDDVAATVSPTKGSILAGDGSLFQELLVGSDDQVLVADSTTSTGLRWDNAAGTFTRTAGENLLLGDLLAINSSGEVVKADPDFSNNNWELIHVALAAASASSPVDVASTGDTIPVLFGAVPAASSNGEFVFLSATPGEASLTPPPTAGNVRFIVGVLQGADGVTLTPEVAFQPQYIARGS